MSHRHPVFCIVPPHMLREISQRGTDAQKQLALRTLAASDHIRQRRRVISSSARLAMEVVGGKNRIVYDAGQGTQLPGTKARTEGQPPAADAAVNEAYDGSGVTYDLYSKVYARNSIDGSGMDIKSTVHYDKGYDNAFWDGQQMVYGDGDEDLPPAERLFNRFTIALDIIGHELTHGVTQYEANLEYQNQPGALNEAISDIFGSLIKQYQRSQTADQADWVIGEGIFTSNINGIGIRSMKAPGTAYNDPHIGKDPQPAHMKDYVTTLDDNGGVHINSGIPNYAFYVMAKEMGGYSWEKAGQIWYLTLTKKLNSKSNFQNAADLTYIAAGELYGGGSLEQQAVKTGWSAVGINITSEPGEAPPQQGEGCFNAVLRALGLSK